LYPLGAESRYNPDDKRAMLFYPETDSLYIELREEASADIVEVAPDIVVDPNAPGGIVGITIDHARQQLSLKRVELHNLPLKALVAQQLVERSMRHAAPHAQRWQPYQVHCLSKSPRNYPEGNRNNLLV
jgi:uncharacterized protein YuzE